MALICWRCLFSFSFLISDHKQRTQLAVCQKEKKGVGSSGGGGLRRGENKVRGGNKRAREDKRTEIVYSAFLCC